MDDVYVCEDCEALFYDPFFRICPYCGGQVLKADKCVDCGYIGPMWQFWGTPEKRICERCQAEAEHKIHVALMQFTEAQKEYMDYKFDGDSFTVI